MSCTSSLVIGRGVVGDCKFSAVSAKLTQPVSANVLAQMCISFLRWDILAGQDDLATYQLFNN